MFSIETMKTIFRVTRILFLISALSFLWGDWQFAAASAMLGVTLLTVIAVDVVEIYLRNNPQYFNDSQPDAAEHPGE